MPYMFLTRINHTTTKYVILHINKTHYKKEDILHKNKTHYKVLHLT